MMNEWTRRLRDLLNEAERTGRPIEYAEENAPVLDSSWMPIGEAHEFSPAHQYRLGAITEVRAWTPKEAAEHLEQTAFRIDKPADVWTIDNVGRDGVAVRKPGSNQLLLHPYELMAAHWHLTATGEPCGVKVSKPAIPMPNTEEIRRVAKLIAETPDAEKLLRFFAIKSPDNPAINKEAHAANVAKLTPEERERLKSMGRTLSTGTLQLEREIAGSWRNDKDVEEIDTLKKKIGVLEAELDLSQREREILGRKIEKAYQDGRQDGKQEIVDGFNRFNTECMRGHASPLEYASVGGPDVPMKGGAGGVGEPLRQRLERVRQRQAAEDREVERQSTDAMLVEESPPKMSPVPPREDLVRMRWEAEEARKRPPVPVPVGAKIVGFRPLTEAEAEPLIGTMIHETATGVAWRVNNFDRPNGLEIGDGRSKSRSVTFEELLAGFKTQNGQSMGVPEVPTMVDRMQAATI